MESSAVDLQDLSFRAESAIFAATYDGFNLSVALEHLTTSLAAAKVAWSPGLRATLAARHREPVQVFGRPASSFAEALMRLAEDVYSAAIWYWTDGCGNVIPRDERDDLGPFAKRWPWDGFDLDRQRGEFERLRVGLAMEASALVEVAPKPPAGGGGATKRPNAKAATVPGSKRGRRPEYDAKADEKILADWESSKRCGTETIEEFCRLRNIDEEKARAALDRARKRRNSR